MLETIWNLFLENPFGQVVWIIAFLISIYNFLFCKDRKFIIVTAIASLVWWIHFFAIWALVAAYINFFDIFKNAASLKWERNKSWMWKFIIAYIIIWLYTFLNIDLNTFSIWELSYFSLLPTFSAIFSTYLVFMTNWVKMKMWFLLVVLAWLIYNIAFWSIWWVMTDLSLLVAWLIWTYRDTKKATTELW